MNLKADFVHGGGWVTHETVGRPKARFFLFLSVVWLVVSVSAGILVYSGSVELFPFHRWACIFLVALQVLFILLAVIFAFTEKPRIFVQRLPNPESDAHNLY